MKRTIQYSILKIFDKNNPQLWDGPFKSLSEAKKNYEKNYVLDQGEACFVVGRHTTEKVWPRSKKVVPSFKKRR